MYEIFFIKDLYLFQALSCSDASTCLAISPPMYMGFQIRLQTCKFGFMSRKSEAEVGQSMARDEAQWDRLTNLQCLVHVHHFIYIFNTEESVQGKTSKLFHCYILAV